MDWMCSRCLRRYSTDELSALPLVPAVPEDPDPRAPGGHGFLSVCVCGSVFHRDRWRLQENVEAEGRTYWVSTLALELNRGWGEQELWYETIVCLAFAKQMLRDLYCARYTTQAEAEAGHLLIVSNLLSGHLSLSEEVMQAEAEAEMRKLERG